MPQDPGVSAETTAQPSAGDKPPTDPQGPSPAAPLDPAGPPDAERPARQLQGWVALAVGVVSAVIGAGTLVQVFWPLPQGNQFSLILFLAGVLPLTFLLYRSGLQLPAGIRARVGGGAQAERKRNADAPTPADWGLAVVALIVAVYPLIPFRIGEAGGGFDEFLNRQGLLAPLDVVAGGVLLLLVLEAARRTTGWVLPVVCVVFFGYAYYGGFLPQSWPIAHQGMDFDQIVNALYNTTSGFYGIPLDVAATYIVLFTIYGAVLDLSGAGRFFVDLSVAAFRRSRAAAGRTAVASGFLLGTVSGSGSATAVSIGAVTWPILRRAGYPPEQAGGMLAAAGVGAILSPPTLGAAAFIIAEYLGVSYLTVLGWALVPTLLYYLGILLAVEVDARRFGVRQVDVDVSSPWRLLGRFGYHFLSLFVIVALLAWDVSPQKAVVYATGVAFLLSFLDRKQMLTPRRVAAAVSSGVTGVLAVAAVCAAAGIITAVTTKTGLGPQLASLLVDGARNVTDEPSVVLALTVLFAAVAIIVLGLAVPVTASFIIGWVVIGPALLDLGVQPAEAAMFVFYYSVLSEVSPPTALAAVAASAITGGRVIPTMWQAGKYALPAFLAPVAFVLTDPGAYLLGRGPVVGVLWATAVAMVAVAALAVATGGWLVGSAGAVERLLAGAAALALLYLVPAAIATGVALLAAAVVVHLLRRAAQRRDKTTGPAGPATT